MLSSLKYDSPSDRLPRSISPTTRNREGSFVEWRVRRNIDRTATNAPATRESPTISRGKALSLPEENSSKTSDTRRKKITRKETKFVQPSSAVFNPTDPPSRRSSVTRNAALRDRRHLSNRGPLPSPSASRQLSPMIGVTVG